MRGPRTLSIAVALLVLAGGSMGGLPGTVSSAPIRITQVHIVAFSGGQGEVSGMASSMDHLVAEIRVPNACRVLSASLEVSRVRYHIQELPLAMTPRSMWCGDLDGNGLDDDLLLAFPDDDLLEWVSLEGEPPALVSRLRWQVPDATAVTVDDLDRDKLLDIVAASASEGTIYVLEALSVDSYAEPRVHTVGPRPAAISAQDLDRDFRRDLVVANSGGSSMSILRGAGDLGFYPRLIQVGRGPSVVRLFDVDKDLDTDMVVAESRNATVTVLYNEGNGNFTNTTVLSTGEGPVDLDVRDANGDSLADVVVACSGADQVMVFGQQPDGSFPLVEVLPVGRAPRAVRVHQANRLVDSNMDVETACSGSDNVTVWLSGDDLTHSEPVDVPVAGRPVALGHLRGGMDLEDTLVVACQMPPALVLATPLAVADGIRVGFGAQGRGSEIRLPQGVENTTVAITEGLQAYIDEHHGTTGAAELPVRVEVWAERPGWVRLSGLDLWYQRNRPPRADAGPDITAQVGEAVELNGSASYDADGDDLSYHWYIEGPDPSHAERVSFHVFGEPGTYFVMLEVADQWFFSDRDDKKVLVNAPPLARGDVPASVVAREPVRLSAHRSEDLDGTIVDYIWDYGQGVVHGRSVDVSFAGQGSWNVTLEVVDDLGARGVASYTVEVLPSEEPVREPAELMPSDQGEVPGPGALATALAMTAAAVVAAIGRRRRGTPRPPYQR